MSAIIEVDPKLATEGQTLLREVSALEVIDRDTYLAVAELRKQGKELINRIKEAFKPIKQAQDAAKKVTLKTEADLLYVPTRVVTTADQNMRAWEITEELKRRDAQRAAQEAARRAIEEERLAEAIELDKTDPGAAQALLEAPIVATVSVESTVPEIAGMSQRESWSAEVVSLQALVAYVADHVEFMNLLLPNEPALNAMARAQKSLLQLPGVQPVVKSSYVQR